MVSYENRAFRCGAFVKVDKFGMAEIADELPNWSLDVFNTDDNSERRFIDVSEDNDDKVIFQRENENTRKKTNYR